MAIKIKFIIYAPGNRNYGYCRLHFGYQCGAYVGAVEDMVCVVCVYYRGGIVVIDVS